MKKVISILVLALMLNTQSAYADVYVKVDANGIAIDGPIMCDAGTCGAGSTFSRLTLKEGERYVLQGTGSAGIGGNNPNTQVQVDTANVWTVTNTQTQQVVQQFTPSTSPGNDRPIVIPNITPVDSSTIKTDTKTATVDTKTVTVDTKTIVVDTITTTSVKSIVQLSNVVWALKNTIMEIKALVARIMIRTKGK